MSTTSKQLEMLRDWHPGASNTTPATKEKTVQHFEVAVVRKQEDKPQTIIVKPTSIMAHNKDQALMEGLRLADAGEYREALIPVNELDIQVRSFS